MYGNIIYNAARLVLWGVRESQERGVWDNFKAARADAKAAKRVRLCQKVAVAECPATPVAELCGAMGAVLDAQAAYQLAEDRHRAAAMKHSASIRKPPAERDAAWAALSHAEIAKSQARGEVVGAAARCDVLQARIDQSQWAAFTQRMVKHPSW